MKICSVCFENKALSSFSKDRANKDGLRSNCRICVNKYNKIQRTKHPERNRINCKSYRENNLEKIKNGQKNHYLKNKDRITNKILMKTYGISLEYKKELFDYQCGQCKICSTRFEKVGSAHIDHCHETGKIRGLLCQKCNRGIGMFNEQINLLKIAIEYIENNGKIKR